MKKLGCSIIFLFIPLILAGTAAPFAPLQNPPQQQRQPGPGKKFVETPFGPIEVDLSDPRPGIAFGPALQPAAPPPAQVPAQPAPPPPVAPQAQAGQDDPTVPVTLRFDNQDIHQVIRIIAELLRINYVIDPTVKGVVNMTTAGELRRSDLLPILEAILKVNGATMVRVGNLYQIVPANTAVRMPLEVQSSQQPVASDDQVVLQIIAMKYVAADEMGRLLAPYVSEGGNIAAQGNLLLISDRRSNLRKLLEIVNVFDTRAFEGERVRILPIKNNAVRDVIEDLKSVFAGYALSQTSAIRFLPIERMNSILVISPNPTVFPEVEKWLQLLDQPIEVAGLRNFVYRVKNSKASDIQKVLSELYGNVAIQLGVAPAPPAGGAPAPTAAAGMPGAAATATGAGAAQIIPEQTAPAVRLSGELRIIADTVNNALVIQSTPQDYQAIERIITELDILPRQVLIDAQVYEVVLDHSLSLGLSAVLQNRDTQVNRQTTASFVSGAAGGAPSLSATTFAFIGRTRELIAFLNASENRSRVRTLSAPSILVSNNSNAQVQIGAEVPVPTSSSVTPVQQGGTNLFAQTIEFRSTGVLLNVSPQINAGGSVTLTIAQEISQAQANTTSAIVAPVIGKSAVRSTIVVRNGQTIALTGFIREGDELVRNRVPLLGSIPGLGILFGNTQRSKNRTELIVLITPHVINTAEEAVGATDELKGKLKEIQGLSK